MNLHGSCLSFPCRADERGTLSTVSDPAEMAEQFLRDLVETRQGERVMLPDYGIPDRIFAVMGAGFTALLAVELEEQARDYLPMIGKIKVMAGESGDDGVFTPGFTLDRHRAAISVEYLIRGDNTPRNLVLPTFQFRGEA